MWFTLYYVMYYVAPPLSRSYVELVLNISIAENTHIHVASERKFVIALIKHGAHKLLLLLQIIGHLCYHTSIIMIFC